MNTQRHAQIEVDLKAFFDNELPFFRRQIVGRHIKNCPKCQQEIEFMQTIERELETVIDAPLDTDLRAHILESVPTPSPAVSTQTQQPARKANKARFVEMGLALMLVGFLGVGTLTMMGRRISNTFNAASNQINTSTGDEYYSSAGSSPRIRTQAEKRVVENFTFSNGASPSNVPQQRAVHREGNLTVTVDNADAASSAVESIVKNTSGFVANNALSTGTDGKRAATLDLRIPVAEFENVVEKVSKLGKVSAKSVSGEDITARVAKAGATKSTLSKELSIREAQLREKEKKAKKSDADALYYLRADVRNLRVQASQARAELETLQKFAALANLFVTLQDKEKPVAPVGWTTDINQTGQSAWSSFLSAAKLPIQLLIWVLAYSPLWIPALIIWKKFGRKWLES